MKNKLTGIVLLIALLTLANNASAQFTITIPKIPKIKKQIPTTDTQPTDTTSTATSSDDNPSSSPSAPGVRGRPISGARITFSNNPDGSNPKTTFSSSEYIYGRLDLGGRTMYDAFGLKNQGANAKFYYINYDMQIWKPGQQPSDNNWAGHSYTLVTKEDAQKTYWNFDVLPEPTRVSTLRSAVADEFEYYKGVAGVYSTYYDADSARRRFPDSGTYTIDITLYGDSYDDWGKRTNHDEMYPTVSAQAAFQFSGSDGQTLVTNAVKARDSLEAVRNRRDMLHAMPDFWARGAAPPDARLAPARLVPMIKSYIGQWNLTYMKHMIYPISGPAWAIEKNDLGIPRYRRFTSAIYIIYRDPKENGCKMGYLEFYEPYAGGGTYSQGVLNGISDVKSIDCAVVR
jgi:hypothetical protein